MRRTMMSGSSLSGMCDRSICGAGRAVSSRAPGAAPERSVVTDELRVRGARRGGQSTHLLDGACLSRGPCVACASCVCQLTGPSGAARVSGRAVEGLLRDASTGSERVQGRQLVATAQMSSRRDLVDGAECALAKFLCELLRVWRGRVRGEPAGQCGGGSRGERAYKVGERRCWRRAVRREGSHGCA